MKVLKKRLFNNRLRYNKINHICFTTQIKKNEIWVTTKIFVPYNYTLFLRKLKKKIRSLVECHKYEKINIY